MGMIGSYIPQEILIALILISIWDLVWKVTAMWDAARKNKLVWFICIAIFNTAGILPIAYLGFFANKKQNNNLEKVKRKKKR